LVILKVEIRFTRNFDSSSELPFGIYFSFSSLNLCRRYMQSSDLCRFGALSLFPVPRNGLLFPLRVPVTFPSPYSLPVIRRVGEWEYWPHLHCLTGCILLPCWYLPGLWPHLDCCILPGDVLCVCVAGVGGNWCWGLNPGSRACWANILQLVLLSQT
jgi:hypothetical protein